MNTVLQFLKTRKIGYWFMLGAEICAAVALILYCVTGTNMFVTELSVSVIALSVSAVAVGVFSLMWEIKLVKYGMYILGLAAWLKHLTVQINYITNVLVAIDGTTLSAAFVITVIFGLLSWVFALVSAILQKDHVKALPFARKAEEGADE